MHNNLWLVQPSPLMVKISDRWLCNRVPMHGGVAVGVYRAVCAHVRKRRSCSSKREHAAWLATSQLDQVRPYARTHTRTHRGKHSTSDTAHWLCGGTMQCCAGDYLVSGRPVFEWSPPTHTTTELTIAVTRVTIITFRLTNPTEDDVTHWSCLLLRRLLLPHISRVLATEA